MKVHELLEHHINDLNLCPGATTYAQWKTKPWLEAVIYNRTIPIFPMRPIRDALSIHDIHHILTGYETTLKGEAELAAWELASGGCHLNIIFWIDRISLVFIGLVTHPRATLRAAKFGLHHRNLFRFSMRVLEHRDVDAIKNQILKRDDR